MRVTACSARSRARTAIVSSGGRGLTRVSPRPPPSLLRWHPQRAVEPDHLAVELLVLDDVRGSAGTRRGGRGARGTGSPCRAIRGSRPIAHRAVGSQRCPVRRADADPRGRKIARDRERHPDNAALRRGEGDLAVKGGDRGRVAACARRSQSARPRAHRVGGQPQHVEGAARGGAD
jgi:hypothetical protein